MKKLLFTLPLITTALITYGQSNVKMDFEKYDPPSTLVVREHKLTRAKYPFIDVHNHQFGMPTQDLHGLLKDMDKLNMQVMVNLSGQSGETLQKSINNIKTTAPKRFIVFANVNFNGVGTEGWTQNAVKQLEQDVKNGANGLKIYKSFGFTVKDNTGKGVTVDDPRLDPV